MSMFENISQIFLKWIFLVLHYSKLILYINKTFHSCEAGKMKPNLGMFDSPPDWNRILQHFRGSELQNYFTKILEDTLKATIKPQYVDHIPRAIRGKVGAILKQKDERTELEGWDCLDWAGMSVVTTYYFMNVIYSVFYLVCR